MEDELNDSTNHPKYSDIIPAFKPLAGFVIGQIESVDPYDEKKEIMEGALQILFHSGIEYNKLCSIRAWDLILNRNNLDK